MATDKELLRAFRAQFHTGGMFTESNVLVLMGYARGEERKAKAKKEPAKVTSKTKGDCPFTGLSCIHADVADRDDDLLDEAEEPIDDSLNGYY